MQAGGFWDIVNGTRLLNSLVPAGWNTTNALSVSNSGLILAQGSLSGARPSMSNSFSLCHHKTTRLEGESSLKLQPPVIRAVCVGAGAAA
jgi:hypothetical protein